MTAKAELLALSEAVKELLFLNTLISKLSVKLTDVSIPILCDNTTTLKLVLKKLALIKTNLRHVNIHNHWLMQEVSKERIKVQFVPLAKNVVDGLIKPV